MSDYKASQEYIKEVQSRVRHNGKIYRGEAGRQLLRRRLEKQTYYERNKSEGK